MPNLDLVMTGDCIGAVTALGNTERAVRSLQSRAGSGVGVAVSVGGARAAAKDLGSVQTALAGTSAAAAGFNRTPIAGGLSAGAAAARGLTGTLGATNRAMGETRTGAGALAVASAGATRSMGGMVPVVAGMTSRLGAMSRATGAVAAGTGRLQSSLAAQQSQAARGMPVMAMANGEMRAMAANSTAAAAGMNRMAGASGGAMGAIRGAVDDFRGYVAAPIIAEAQRAGAGGRYPSPGGPPPIAPVPPRGGGGGGGGDDDAERRGAAAGKAGAEVGKGIGTLLMAGMAVGIATNSAYTKHAMDAINATISNTPGLASKAKDAADELGKGIGDITKDVDVDKYADAFAALGNANRGLGKIQGQIGMDTLEAKLETETQMANATANAYIRMGPAFDAAIRGSNNLGIALLDGISNPQVANGVRAFSEAIAKPEIAKGLSDLTTGATASMLVFGKIVADVTGVASKAINGLFGGQNVTDASGAVFGGIGVATLAKGGMGSKLAAGLLGGSAVYGSQKLMAEGRDDEVLPSVINGALGALIGARFGMAGMAAGGLIGQWGTIGMGSAGPKSVAAQLGSPALTGLLAGLTAGSIAGPIGAVIGGTVGLAAGTAYGASNSTDPDLLARPLWGPGSDSRIPLSATPGPGPDASFWEKQSFNMFGTRPESSASRGLAAQDAAAAERKANVAAGKGSGGRTQADQLMSRQEATQKRVDKQYNDMGLKGPYSGATVAPTDDAQTGQSAPQQRQTATQDRVDSQYNAQGKKGPYSGTGGAPPPVNAPATAAPRPLPPPQQVAPSLFDLGSAADTATQSVQGLGQALPQAAQQAQQLPAALAPVSQLPKQANAQMTTAASIIQSSAQQVGSSIPPAISTGIVKQTPQVCNAAADMGNSMVNCTARAIGYASPAKKFIALGESTGQGAAIGVNNSAGGAIDAVGGMASGMLAAVGALGSGVEAASDGAVPVAESGGLMVGYVWARSVQTGMDSVLKSSDFAAASMPAISSALAKTTLGRLGLLGLAGSGASISKSAGGGMISMPTPVVNATFQVSVDGTPLQVIAQRQIDGAMDALADSFSRQRG